MLLAHLHARGRDAPFGAVEIELGPRGPPQLARPHEHEGSEAQRAFGDEGAFVTIDRAQQFADGFRLDDADKMRMSVSCIK